MKKPKSIFYLIYFLFHVSLLLASIYVNYKSEDFEFLINLRGHMDLMIYVTILGLILFFVDVVLVTMTVRSHKKEKEKLEHEINSLKAKMFDLQSVSGSQRTTSTIAEGDKEEEKDQ
ncbi:hypothetical protein LVD15_10995 [Fulvivirga maritima]|uniref:hypothetical protein n=1 Tax=Fulvivirga maritima TaxID=2904247 RepID=UPI001F342DF7|nr:hypothetical protein [Fulvivirga maritima]UII28926.1 hypothetical protein LVD15_10995 [Fulvivirga maritima]